MLESQGSYKAVQVKAMDERPGDKLGAIAGIKEGANGTEIKLDDKGKVNTDNPFESLTTEE